MTTTTPRPTPPVEGCRDENTYCSAWAARGECSRNPSYMLNNCKRSCNACEGSPQGRYLLDYIINNKLYLRDQCNS